MLHDHVPSREVVHFQTGGVLQWFGVAKTIGEFIALLSQATQLQQPVRVIGSGSRVLVADGGHPGVLIQNKCQGMHLVRETSQLIVESGMPVRQLVAQTVALGYSGLEFLSGYPGTIGGAVVANASVGAHFISDYVRAATILLPSAADRAEAAVRSADRSWFDFGFATSRIRRLYATESETPVILSVTLQLSKMTPASCVQRLQTLHQKRLSIPDPTLPALEVFATLRLERSERNEHDVTATRSMRIPPLSFIAPHMLRQWREGDITAFGSNPNWILNNLPGTSTAARHLIERMQTETASEHVIAQPIIDYIGVW